MDRTYLTLTLVQISSTCIHMCTEKTDSKCTHACICTLQVLLVLVRKVLLAQRIQIWLHFKALSCPTC